jgi:hypothetical protein
VKRAQRKYAGDLYRDFKRDADMPPFEDWLKQVEAIDVYLDRGGRVVMQPPTAECVVELHWERQPTDRGRRVMVSAITVDYQSPDFSGYAAFLTPPTPMHVYYAAFLLAIEDEPDPLPAEAISAPKPAPGKPLSVGFYRKLNAEYDELVKAGTRTPSKDLARRYDVKESTMKSWRHRAKQFREEQER